MYRISVCVTSLELFGEGGAKSPLQLSPLTHFNKINNKKVIPEIQLKHKKSVFETIDYLIRMALS